MMKVRDVYKHEHRALMQVAQNEGLKIVFHEMFSKTLASCKLRFRHHFPARIWGLSVLYLLRRRMHPWFKEMTSRKCLHQH